MALAAAGALSEEDLIRLSFKRGRAIREAARTAPGGMIAADNTAEAIQPLLAGVPDVWIANHNSPTQTVIAGTDEGVKTAAERLQAAGIRSQRIAVACGFHSPLIAGARPALADALAKATFTATRKPVFSNTSARPHPSDGSGIARQLAEHLVSPVRFADEVRAMYEAGARVFVEVGPNAVLTGLAGQILAGHPHLAIASDTKSRSGLIQLAHLLGQVLAAGVPANLDRLFAGRGLQPFELAKFNADTGKPKHTPTTWVVNGVRSKPLNAPEPRLLGQPLPANTAPQPKPTVQPTATQGKSEARPLSKAPTSSAAATPPSRGKMHNTEMSPALPAPSTNGHVHATAAPHIAPDGAAAVMLRFQEVMARFLDTQKSVMLGFLGAANGSVAAPTTAYPALPQVIGDRDLSPPKPGFTAAPNGTPHGNGHATMPAVTPLPVPALATNRIGAPVAPPAASSAAPPAALPAPTANGKREAAPVQKADAILDRETLLARLLDLVSERTGYPKEALSIDLDLEADLGVDSIKRVEVLGALAESIEAGADGKQPNLEMEKLSVIKTLRGIADYVMTALNESATSAPATGSSPGGTTAGSSNAIPSTNGKHEVAATSTNGDLHPGARRGEVQRLVVRLIDTPLPIRPTFAPPAGTIVITDDELGAARELADRLAELDVKTALDPPRFRRRFHGRPHRPCRRRRTDRPRSLGVRRDFRPRSPVAVSRSARGRDSRTAHAAGSQVALSARAWARKRYSRGGQRGFGGAPRGHRYGRDDGLWR